MLSPLKMQDASKRDERDGHSGMSLGGPGERSLRNSPFTGRKAEATKEKGLVQDSQRPLETSLNTNKQIY